MSFEKPENRGEIYEERFEWSDAPENGGQAETLVREKLAELGWKPDQARRFGISVRLVIEKATPKEGEGVQASFEFSANEAIATIHDGGGEVPDTVIRHARSEAVDDDWSTIDSGVDDVEFSRDGRTILKARRKDGELFDR